MQVRRFYRSFLGAARYQDRRALVAFKARCWEDAAEGDMLRATALNMRRLEFIRKLVQEGKLEG